MRLARKKSVVEDNPKVVSSPIPRLSISGVFDKSSSESLINPIQQRRRSSSSPTSPTSPHFSSSPSSSSRHILETNTSMSQVVKEFENYDLIVQRLDITKAQARRPSDTNLNPIDDPLLGLMTRKRGFTHTGSASSPRDEEGVSNSSSSSQSLKSLVMVGGGGGERRPSKGGDSERRPSASGVTAPSPTGERRPSFSKGPPPPVPAKKPMHRKVSENIAGCSHFFSLMHILTCICEISLQAETMSTVGSIYSPRSDTDTDTDLSPPPPPPVKTKPLASIACKSL
jgi:hypothetical protein